MWRRNSFSGNREVYQKFKILHQIEFAETINPNDALTIAETVVWKELSEGVFDMNLYSFTFFFHKLLAMQDPIFLFING